LLVFKRALLMMVGQTPTRLDAEKRPVGPQSHVRHAGEIQRHPNGYYYLVMERVSGKSLQQVLARRQRMLTRRMLDYCAQMSRIVDDSHTANWAWRDCDAS
jgi:serine/threonine protein kinase